MEWTELFFRHRASRWKTLAAESSPLSLANNSNGEPELSQRPPSSSELDARRSQGHACYALKLESMWNRLAQQAALRFSAARANIRPSQHRTRPRSPSSSSNDQS